MKTYKNIIQFSSTEITLYKKLSLVDAFKTIKLASLQVLFDDEISHKDSSEILPLSLN